MASVSTGPQGVASNVRWRLTAKLAKPTESRRWELRFGAVIAAVISAGSGVLAGASPKLGLALILAVTFLAIRSVQPYMLLGILLLPAQITHIPARWSPLVALILMAVLFWPALVKRLLIQSPAERLSRSGYLWLLTMTGGFIALGAAQAGILHDDKRKIVGWLVGWAILPVMVGYGMISPRFAASRSTKASWFNALAVYAAVNSLVSIVQFGTRSNFIASSYLDPLSVAETRSVPGFVRGVGLFYDANGLSLFLCISLPVFLCARATANKPRNLTALCALVVAGVGASLSRLGLGMLAIIFVTFTAQRWRRILRRPRTLVAILVIAIPVGVVGIGRMTAGGAVGARDAQSTQTRGILSRRALSAATEKPILGYGLGSSQLILDSRSEIAAEYALGTHEGYLDFLLDGGALLLIGGVVAIVATGVAISRPGQRLLSSLPAMLLLAGAFVESTFQQVPLWSCAVASVALMTRLRPSVAPRQEWSTDTRGWLGVSLQESELISDH